MTKMQFLKGMAMAAGVAAGSLPALAFDWQACDKDLKKNCPAATADAQISNCLEKAERSLSKLCKAAYRTYEKESTESQTSAPKTTK